MSDAAATSTATADTPEYRQQLLAGPQKIALMAAIGGGLVFLLLAGIIFASTDSTHAGKSAPMPIQQVFLSYLTGFSFWVSVGLGSVFFLLVQYVTGGRWGILLRRPLESSAKTLWLGLLLFIPVAATMFMGEKSIYWWARHAAHEHAHAAPGADGHATQPKKMPFNVHPELNIDEEEKIHDWLFPEFTAARGVLYFLIFMGLVAWMSKNAHTAENAEDLEVARKARDRQKFVGSVGLFVFALTLTLIATDWWMSLEDAFSSSMFPIITFDNAAVTAYCTGLLTLLYFKNKNDSRFVNLFPPTEQIHLGSLMLAFTLAWTYFNFSQYMLIWIGNLAEEIPYYLKRTREGWQYYAIFAVIFHFPLPFLLLMFRRVKSNPKALRNIACMLLCVCFMDVMWWISPSMSHADSPKFYWLMDVAAWVGIGGLWIYFVIGQLKKHPLLPTREMYILEAYHHGH